MDNKELLNWWLEKYIPEIINYINANVAFEELTPEELEIKRKKFIFAYIDSCNSPVVFYLLLKIEGFFDKLYEAIYPIAINNDAQL